MKCIFAQMHDTRKKSLFTEHAVPMPKDHPGLFFFLRGRPSWEMTHPELVACANASHDLAGFYAPLRWKEFEEMNHDELVKYVNNAILAYREAVLL